MWTSHSSLCQKVITAEWWCGVWPVIAGGVQLKGLWNVQHFGSAITQSSPARWLKEKHLLNTDATQFSWGKKMYPLSFVGKVFFSWVAVFFSLVLSKVVTSSIFGLSLMVAYTKNKVVSVALLNKQIMQGKTGDFEKLRKPKKACDWRKTPSWNVQMRNQRPLCELHKSIYPAPPNQLHTVLKRRACLIFYMTNVDFERVDIRSKLPL